MKTTKAQKTDREIIHIMYQILNEMQSINNNLDRIEERLHKDGMDL